LLRKIFFEKPEIFTSKDDLLPLLCHGHGLSPPPDLQLFTPCGQDLQTSATFIVAAISKEESLFD
jgi:hypothetical protein